MKWYLRDQRYVIYHKLSFPETKNPDLKEPGYCGILLNIIWLDLLLVLP